MAWPPVLFSAADTVVVTELAARLAARGDTATVTTIVPDPRPSRLVVVFRTGGARRDQLTDNAQLTIECWEASDTAAHDLAQLVRALINAMPGRLVAGVPVYRVNEAAGPQALPEPNSALARFTWSVQIALRGTALN
jgi:hypothetical protein